MNYNICSISQIGILTTTDRHGLMKNVLKSKYLFPKRNCADYVKVWPASISI